MTTPTRVTIKDVRFNYTGSLFTAQKPKTGEGKEKFSVVAIFGKNHPQLAEIKAAMTAAAEGKWGAKHGEVLKQLAAGDRLCLHDGDAKSDKPGYAGNLFINASNELRPGVFGPQREVLVAADGKPYSGSYGNIIVEFWAQDNQFGKRVNASLLGVQHVKDGERLAGGGVAAADDFEAIPEAGQAKAAATGTGAAGLF
jgi:hypothetical protein